MQDTPRNIWDIQKPMEGTALDIMVTNYGAGFIRGQGSALVHTEGTGLGLYVGRMMVEAHGGAIWVESKGEGLGSTFAFAIPLPEPPKDQSVVALEEMLG